MFTFERFVQTHLQNSLILVCCIFSWRMLLISLILGLRWIRQSTKGRNILVVGCWRSLLTHFFFIDQDAQKVLQWLHPLFLLLWVRCIVGNRALIFYVLVFGFARFWLLWFTLVWLLLLFGVVDVISAYFWDQSLGWGSRMCCWLCSPVPQFFGEHYHSSRWQYLEVES